MLFQTLEFFSFFIIFFFLYNFSSLRIQNVLLLLAGCFFYSTWSLKTLPILLFSIFFNFYGAVYLRSLERTTYKKHLLTFLIFLNLFFLILFKYFILDWTRLALFALNLNLSIKLFTFEIYFYYDSNSFCYLIMFASLYFSNYSKSPLKCSSFWFVK